MARAREVGFTELDHMFDVLISGNVEAAKKAVDAAAPILEASVRSHVAAAASRGYATGGLAGSFKATPAKQNEFGVFSAVRPVGGRDGHAYSERARWLEYGVRTPHGVHQAPSPFRSAAAAAVKAECERIMEETFDEFVKSAGGE